MESASTADSAGVGTIGDTTGIATELFTTTTPTSLTAEFLSIAITSIMPVDFTVPTGFTEPADFMAKEREDSLVAGMDLLRHTASPVLTLAHSAALIMVELQGAFPLVGSPALAVVSTEAEVSTEAVTGNSVFPKTRLKIETKDMERTIMYTNHLKLETFAVRFARGFTSIVIFLLLVGLVLLVSGLAGASFAQDSQPRTFSSAAEAADALFQAVQKEDEPALESILGAGKEVASSSDDVDDKLEREQFSKKYQEMHRLVKEPEGSTVLYIGAENWPFPIPLMSKNGAWYFDSDHKEGAERKASELRPDHAIRPKPGIRGRRQ